MDHDTYIVLDAQLWGNDVLFGVVFLQHFGTRLWKIGPQDK